MTDDAAHALNRSLLILGAVVVVTAWFSDLFYFPDEQFQILEFMSHKLGITPASSLPWEFTDRIRPWLQPALYYAIARPLMAAGLTDLFTIGFVLRLVSGLVSLAALAAFARSLLPTIAGDEQKLAFARYLPWFGFLPYLFVRTSSENLSGAFFAFALALAITHRRAGALAGAGLLCGLAFECRYQTGLLTLGLLLWLAVMARVRAPALAAFTGGGIAALALGALADRWGYGAWVFPPLGYLQFNVLNGGAAHQFGREPVFAYLYLLPAHFFFAIILVLMAAMPAMWLRNPRHPVTWVTLPFVLAHVLIAHKEARFLFPLAILATAFPVLGFSPLLPRGQRFFARVWGWRKSRAAHAVTALSVVFMVYLALYPFGIRPHMPMARYLYRHFSGTFYSATPPFQSYPMYRSHPFRAEQGQLQNLLGEEPVYWMADTPAPLTVPGATVTLLYSEFPLARFGYGAAGAGYIRGWSAFAARHGWLKLLPLRWYTLYRVERSATIRS